MKYLIRPMFKLILRTILFIINILFFVFYYIMYTFWHFKLLSWNELLISVCDFFSETYDSNVIDLEKEKFIQTIIRWANLEYVLFLNY